MPKLDLIGLVVDDMAKTLAFYRALGMNIPPEADKEGHVEVVLPGSLRMAWDSVEVIRSFSPDWIAPTEGHRIGLAFLCDNPADVDSTYARLTGLGYQSHHEPFDAPWNQRYAQIYDPDGNVIDLFCAL